MRTLAELAAAGLRGKALTDALYEDMFGHPRREEPLSPEQKREAWESFLALRDAMTPDELNDGLLDHRKRIRESYDKDLETNAA